MGRPEKQRFPCEYCFFYFDCKNKPRLNCSDFQPGSDWYRYLCRAHWRTTRIKKLLSVGEKCEQCGSTENLHVHHLRYDHLFDERMEDLRVLCCACHGHEVKGVYQRMKQSIQVDAQENKSEKQDVNSLDATQEKMDLRRRPQ